MESKTLAAYLLPLLALGAIYAIMIRRGGFGFRHRAATLRVRSARGPLMALWLTLVAATWTILELAATTTAIGANQPITASIAVTVVVVTVGALVLAERATVFVLAMLGLSAQAAGIARTYGVSAAVTVLMCTLLTTWLFGVARGVARPAKGAPRG